MLDIALAVAERQMGSCSCCRLAPALTSSMSSNSGLAEGSSFQQSLSMSKTVSGSSNARIARLEGRQFLDTMLWEILPSEKGELEVHFLSSIRQLCRNCWGGEGASEASAGRVVSYSGGRYIWEERIVTQVAATTDAAASLQPSFAPPISPPISCSSPSTPK